MLVCKLCRTSSTDDPCIRLPTIPAGARGSGGAYCVRGRIRSYSHSAFSAPATMPRPTTTTIVKIIAHFIRHSSLSIALGGGQQSPPGELADKDFAQYSAKRKAGTESATVRRTQNTTEQPLLIVKIEAGVNCQY